MPNHLAKETSPYLLQHADNPVDWYPWSEEALHKARGEDKPILLSIGYSACHWCHVMAHESFENPEIAGLMNDLFINIKVDREERPDLDNVYMEAVRAITGRGGWPLTVFLRPDGKPFYGGTYFPPEDRQGIPGFPQVLRTVADAYKHRKTEVESAVNQLVTALSRDQGTSKPTGQLSPDILDHTFQGLGQVFDMHHGGFGTAPKFPQPMVLEFLLRYYRRTGNEDSRHMVELTLGKMARGGVYDQLGGGFHRYATDAIWQIPHFEKMLYDNALLGQVYTHAYVVTGNRLFRTVAEETFDYVLREMRDGEGGFYSSQDADTEGVEGKYYVWTPAEVREVVGKANADKVLEYFGVTDRGNFEGRNILTVAEDIPSEDLLIEEAKNVLLKRRQERTKLGRDEKIIVSWNGLMLCALAEAACVFERDDYLSAAEANGSFLLNKMTENNILRHVYKNGHSKINAFLLDYAAVIEGLLMLHRVTFGSRWLEASIKLGETIVTKFWDEMSGMFYDSSGEDTSVFIRSTSFEDNALPAGASAATLVLLKLARITDNSHLERVAERSLQSARELILRYPLGFGHWLCAIDLYLSSPREVALVGSRDDSATLGLLRTICNTWIPNIVVVAHDPTESAPDIALLKGREMIGGQPTAYFCQRSTCLEPATTAEMLEQQISSD
jgi:uncharacterized protein YyaL (SSP411 family)